MLATTLIGAGLAGTTGVALADTQSGGANVNDIQTIAPTNVCNNDVPVNALGLLQVPIQDVAGNIPLLSPADHGSSNSSGIHKGCGNKVKAHN